MFAQNRSVHWICSTVRRQQFEWRERFSIFLSFWLKETTSLDEIGGESFSAKKEKFNENDLKEISKRIESMREKLSKIDRDDQCFVQWKQKNTKENFFVFVLFLLSDDEKI